MPKDKKAPEEAVESETSLEQVKLKNVPEDDSSKQKKPPVIAILGGEKVITESSDDAREFYNQSRFGEITENGKVELSLLEALYLMEKGKVKIKSDAGRELNFEA